MPTQNRCRCSRRHPGGRPGERIGGLPVLAAAQPLDRPTRTPPAQVLRRLVEFAQYLSIRYTERLAETGIEPSVGTVGDRYDNAMAEPIIGLYKTEVIRMRGPWKRPDDVEYSTLEWVDWFNHRRLLEPFGNIPPAEKEANHHRQTTPAEQAGLTQPSLH